MNHSLHNVICWISDQKVETVESDASSAANDASTTAACPTGYTLIGTQITHFIVQLYIASSGRYEM